MCKYCGVLLVCDALEGVRRLRSIETTRIATGQLNCLARIGNAHLAVQFWTTKILYSTVPHSTVSIKCPNFQLQLLPIPRNETQNPDSAPDI